MIWFVPHAWCFTGFKLSCDYEQFKGLNKLGRTSVTLCFGFGFLYVQYLYLPDRKKYMASYAYIICKGMTSYANIIQYDFLCFIQYCM